MKGLRAKVPETSLKYGEYDISFLPEDARPDQSKNNLGKHSYTLRSSGGVWRFSFRRRLSLLSL